MAKKTIYIPKSDSVGVTKILIEYEYFSGFALSQKQKSINSLHTSAQKNHNLSNLLEISSKSTDKIGVNLSAFNLYYEGYSVEQLFQAGKKFEFGGPFLDLLNKTSKEAKTDMRLKNSGNVIGFRYKDMDFPTEPKTFFYDWLYSNALLQNKALLNKALSFNGFSDIEFNENKSYNCQAYSLALFCSLVKNNPNILDESVISSENFFNYCSDEYETRVFPHQTPKVQPTEKKDISNCIVRITDIESKLKQLLNENISLLKITQVLEDSLAELHELKQSLEYMQRKSET